MVGIGSRAAYMKCAGASLGSGYSYRDMAIEW